MCHSTPVKTGTVEAHLDAFSTSTTRDSPRRVLWGAWHENTNQKLDSNQKELVVWNCEYWILFFYFSVILDLTEVWLASHPQVSWEQKTILHYAFLSPNTCFFLQLLISVTSITTSASGVCQDVIQSVIIRPLLDPLVSRKIDWKLSLTLLFQNNSATFWTVKRLKWA